MTIKSVTLYITKDGKLHDELDKAKEHVCNNVAEIFDKKLKPLLKVDPFWKATALNDLIEALAFDYENLKILMKQLNSTFEDIDIN